jgi:hypothetical protein
MAANTAPPASRQDGIAPSHAVAVGENATARFRMSDGQIHRIEYQRSPSLDQSAFAVGVVRGGSTLLHRVLLDLQPFSNRRLLPVSNTFFSDGVPFHNVIEDVDELFQQPGFIFGTFRWLPQRLHIPALLTRKKILLVRDPRDMLVSAYYSCKESHPIPQAGKVRDSMERSRRRLQAMTVDEYARTSVDGLKSRYFNVMTLLTTRNILLRRYEDIIFNKGELVRDIAEFLEIDVSGDEMTAIAKRHDAFPDTEDPGQHIRQVKPGNFANKLAVSTVEEITFKLRAILAEFGYG